MENLRAFIYKKAADVAIDALLSQKDQLKKAFDEALDKNDLPLPDNIEKPLDDLLSELFGEGLTLVTDMIKKVT